MRVLQAHARYRNRGGEDAAVENEAALLRTAGHRVRLFDAENAAGALAASRQLLRSAWNTAQARRFGAAIEEFKPDIVHIHNTWFAISPSIAARARHHGIPVVMTVHNYRLVCVNSNLFRAGRLCQDCVGRGPWRGVRHRCYRGSAVLSGVLAANIELHRRLGTWDREVDVLVAVSKFGVDRHVAGGVPREKIVVKDNFAPDPGSRDTAPSSSASVLFVGRPTPEKGLNLLIDAWRSARPEGLSLEVIGATGVPVERADESIRFLGEIPSAEVRERMLSARALTLPSQWPEGQPLVMIEALAAGLPVTGTRIGGIEEVLSEDLEASCVPLGDLAGWRAALLELRDDAAVDRRGASARTLYDRRFTPQVALDRLLNVYELATARSASRR